MFLGTVGLLAALLLSCVAGGPAEPIVTAVNPQIPWYKCNSPGTEDVSQQFGQTVRSFRHCLNEDQMFKNSMCDRDINPQAIKIRCMNKTALPLPDFHDFEWYNTKCHDDEVCVDDQGLKAWPSNRVHREFNDSIARCVKPADTAVVWSTNGSPGKHRARWNMIGQDVNYTHLDYAVGVHFLKEDFKTNALMEHADLRVLDKRGFTIMREERIIAPATPDPKPLVGIFGLAKGWHQFEVWVDHAPKAYGFAFTIIDRVAA